jgi:hypothetical protein
MKTTEILTVEVANGTRRRLEMMGFPYDVSGHEVIRFLVEQGLDLLETHRKFETTKKVAA